MKGRLPDFVVIGAMKSGTSSLHEQLALRSRVFMSRPKEPNFFSDDVQYARGLEWYASLFGQTPPDAICGESSTHYTKRPTYPETVSRMHRHLPNARLVYVMRHPVERIVSQYVHEWSQREVRDSLEQAVRSHERYVAYSSYARQLEPFLQTYGPERMLPVAFERLVAHPDEELARICGFIRDPSPEAVAWKTERGAENLSRERLRTSRLREWVRGSPLLSRLKDRLPTRLRESLKAPWRMRGPPELSPATRRWLEERIDADLARLGEWVGLELSCAEWKDHVRSTPLRWSAAGGASTGGGGRGS